jgi:hypothetical protein
MMKLCWRILCLGLIFCISACQQNADTAKIQAIQRVDLRTADISQANIAKLELLPTIELYVGDAIDGQLIGDYPKYDGEIIAIYTGERTIIAATVAETHNIPPKFHKFSSGVGDDFALLVTRPETGIPGHSGCHLIKMDYFPIPNDQVPLIQAGQFYFIKGEIVYLVFGSDGLFVSVSPAKLFPPEGLIESEAPLAQKPTVMNTMPAKNP